MRVHIFKRLGLLVFLVFLLNTAGSFFGWYIVLPWFDMLMHFLGGAWLGLIALWSWYKKIEKRELGMTRVLVFTFLGAILWEGLEYFLQLGVAGAPGLFATPGDSVSDILFGVFGASLVALHYIKKIRT